MAHSGTVDPIGPEVYCGLADHSGPVQWFMVIN